MNAYRNEDAFSLARRLGISEEEPPMSVVEEVLSEVEVEARFPMAFVGETLATRPS